MRPLQTLEPLRSQAGYICEGSLPQRVDVNLSVRQMRLSEVGLIIDCFHRSSPEHLNRLAVTRRVLEKHNMPSAGSETV